MARSLHQEFTSLGEVNQSVDTGKRKGIKRILAFFGPAYLVSVGYMDPGNWATDLAGGSKFGYTLIWVLLMSNLMALLLQSLSARLGIVRGRDLAQANRETYPRYINFVFYVLAEIAIAATDLAEILGMAIGIQLLTGLSLVWGILITVADTFLFLLLQRLGIRKMEAFIICLVAIIGFSFLSEMFIAKPQLNEIAKGFIPSLPNEEALYIAIGIIGATVMPHNLYLHSALVQTRKIKRNNEGIKKALKLNFIDSAIALNAAFFVNAFILILAATAFYKTGRNDVVEIKQAHEMLAPILGTNLAPMLFAIALIASGQSSTITGTLAGQIVMEGYLHLRITPWVRRLITRLVAVVPALLVILIKGEDNVDALLIFSQVLLSLQLGFAIIPLIHFTSDKTKMGEFAIKPYIIALASLITAVLVYLNIRMVVEQAMQYFVESNDALMKLMIIAGGLMYVALLITAIVYPLMNKQKDEKIKLHPEADGTIPFEVPVYKNIGVALDFSRDDKKLIAHALGQGNASSSYFLIHVVESAATRIMGDTVDDMETRNDQERLEHYASELSSKNISSSACLGYNDRVSEIVRIVEENKIDLLVIGSHGHKGLKDIVYGQTVSSVRHNLKIPVLVINM
ncbi:MAG: Nramp family divalent metal transporter [Chitinophagaceae bacterium]|nr:Nramp family divalent metal transporter [Chitinophagaceae bacterium]